MKSKPAVRAGRTSGTDVAPLVAAVTALACMHMQRDIAVYWDWVTRSSVWGAQGMKVVQVILVLFIIGILIMCCLAVTLEMLRDALRVVHVNIKRKMGDMSCEGCVYPHVVDIGIGCEVFEGMHGDVVLVGKDSP